MTALHDPGVERAGAERSWTPDTLTVTVLRSDALRASLRAVGDLDAVGAAILSDALGRQRDLGRRFVRLDMSDIVFLDTAGMRVLAAEHGAFLRGRGTMIVTGLTARARRLLQLVGLDRELLLLEPFAPVTVLAVVN